MRDRRPQRVHPRVSNRKQTTDTEAFYPFLCWCQSFFTLGYGLEGCHSLPVGFADRPAIVPGPSSSAIARPLRLGCVFGCGRSPATGRRPATPNVLLVTIDTLRADRLGCYGHAGAATPTLDALAAPGRALRDRGRARAPDRAVPRLDPHRAHPARPRLPGQRRLRASRRPGNGAPRSSARPATGRRPSSRAFRSTAASGSTAASRPTTTTCPVATTAGARRTSSGSRDATTDAALRWLEAPAPPAPARPFFLWVHYYDPHAPYEPPGDLAERFRASPYDGEIAFVDAQIARLAARARGAGSPRAHPRARDRRPRREPGRARRGHPRALPLRRDAAGSLPHGRAGRCPPAAWPRRSPAASTCLPTLLDYAGLPAPERLEGRSLRPAAGGQARWRTRRPTPSRSTRSASTAGRRSSPCARRATSSIEAPRPELYDLEAGRAREPTNRLAEQGAQAEELRRELEAALARPVRSAAAEVDPETAERLAALGYVGGGGAPRARAPRGRDPKDGARLLPQAEPRHVGRAHRAASARSASSRPCSREDPGLLMARRTRAVAYEASGRFDGGDRRDPRSSRSRAASAPRTASSSATTCASRAGSTRRSEVLERTAQREPPVRPALAVPGRDPHQERAATTRRQAAYEHVLVRRPRPHRGAARARRPRAPRGQGRRPRRRATSGSSSWTRPTRAP